MTEEFIIPPTGRGVTGYRAGGKVVDVAFSHGNDELLPEQDKQDARVMKVLFSPEAWTPYEIYPRRYSSRTIRLEALNLTFQQFEESVRRLFRDMDPSFRELEVAEDHKGFATVQVPQSYYHEKRNLMDNFYLSNELFGPHNDVIPTASLTASVPPYTPEKPMPQLEGFTSSGPTKPIPKNVIPFPEVWRRSAVRALVPFTPPPTPDHLLTNQPSAPQGAWAPRAQQEAENTGDKELLKALCRHQWKRDVGDGTNSSCTLSLRALGTDINGFMGSLTRVFTMLGKDRPFFRHETQENSVTIRVSTAELLDIKARASQKLWELAQRNQPPTR